MTLMKQIAIIGMGRWGKNLVRDFSKLSKVKTCVTTGNRKNMMWLRKNYPNIDLTTDINQVLNDSDIDAVVIATPIKSHFTIARKSLESKKHVFVEKPLTYLSEDGQNLIELAKRNNVILTCGYIERFNPAVASVKDFIKSQKYGDLIRLEFYREHRMPQHINDVGVIYDTSVHDIDTAMWLFDETPEVVFAIAGKINHEHEDFATITLGFKDNKTATISSNWITPIRVRNFNAVCTEARIFSDFITQEIRIETDNGTENPKNEKAEPLSLEIKNFKE